MNALNAIVINFENHVIFHPFQNYAIFCVGLKHKMPIKHI